MTHELILTSVSQGLNPDDHGFCPVAANQTIPQQLVKYLQTLSFYRHIFTEPDPSQPSNPVIYRHLTLPDNEEHILSRIADTGYDYEHQPNTLAHHIILDDNELPPEGPAWLLGLPGFHVTEWNTPAVQFVKGRPIPTLTAPASLTRRQKIARQYRWLDPHKMVLTGSQADTESDAYQEFVRSNDEQLALVAPPTSPCSAWQEQTGDAGWGGVLAETILTGQPAILLYKPGQNLLPLFVESLALLPPHYLWQATFSTYFCGLPKEIACQWKGVIANSDEAKQFVRDLDTLVLNFTAPMKAEPTGKYVEFARQGLDHLLPPDAEEYITSLINSDTKPYKENKQTAETKPCMPVVPPVIVQPSPSIHVRKKPAGLIGLLLHTSSRLQFYFLYSIMFMMVLFLLILVIDQTGDFGIVRSFYGWLHPSAQTSSGNSHVLLPDTVPLEASLDHVPLEAVQNGHDIQEKIEIAKKIWEESRQKQRIPLRQIFEQIDLPDHLPMPVPRIREGEVLPPLKATFAEIAPFYPYGAALELKFIPLFELPSMKVVVKPLCVLDVPEKLNNLNKGPDELPLKWEVMARDNKTHEDTPMFTFHLTSDGLEVDWKPEGLRNQHLYETILSSLGFLRLSVVDDGDKFLEISMFVPAELEALLISDLAESLEEEHVVHTYFAEEPWKQVFEDLQPEFNVVLEIVPPDESAEMIHLESVKLPSHYRVEIRTSQQGSKPTQSGTEFEFEPIWIPFEAEASLDKVVWKNGGYREQLEEELLGKELKKKELETQQKQIKQNVFVEGYLEEKNLLDKLASEISDLTNSISAIEDIWNKLPKSYEEIHENISLRFYYSVYLESPDKKRPKMLILTTKREKGKLERRKE